MHHKSIFSLAIMIWLALLTLACQLPSIFNNNNGQPVEPLPEWPHSNFVPPRESLQARVQEPLYIESYHISRVTRLEQLEISVNGQPLKDENTGEPTFPKELALVQVLVPQPAQPASAQGSPFPSPLCNELLAESKPEQRSLLQKNVPEILEFPAYTWIVCHKWTGLVPGTYDLSLRVVDEAGRPGNRIVQRIEVY